MTKTRVAFISLCLAALSIASQPASGEAIQAANIKAFYRDGQTFVTWTDAAEGEDGAGYRYRLYESTAPITQATLPKATLVIRNIPNNSGKHYGSDLWMKKRIDPEKPMAVIHPDGKPLPQWTGLAVRTIPQNRKTFYAVVVTDTEGKSLSTIVPGDSATVAPVDEKVAPIQPLKTGDSKTRGRYWNSVKISGTKNLPLEIQLHASSAQGNSGDGHGDYYLYWGRPEWGYREGLPWQFTVKEVSKHLICRSRETILKSDGLRAIETYWFGYYCVPQWAGHEEPRAYNFTERRMNWLVPWLVERYNADPNRVYVTGGSMGAWGSSTYALRHPELYSAIYPNRPRIQQRGLPGMVKRAKDAKVLMADGKTDYYDRMNMAEFARNHHGDLPFLGWCCGRHDGYATFKEQIEMVQAMTEAHHGFAFAWNDGNHSSGQRSMGHVTKYYPYQKFARNESYPAFGNSSINDDIGVGEVEVTEGKKVKRILKEGNGVLEGGINLGFDWTEMVDEPDRWSASISNALCKAVMTVDVTPRRCQKFKPTAGQQFNWSTSTGDRGTVTADKWGLVTIQQMKIKPGEGTDLTISK